MRHHSRTVPALAFVLLAVLTVACGKSSNPAAPTDPSSSPTSGAVIQGTVLGTSASARAVDTTGGSMTVSVVGTSISTSVTLTGQFTLNGVPAGDVQLKFHGASGDAILQISQLAQGETITITITIQGPTATAETETRQSGSSQQVEGRIEAIDATAKTLVVAGKTILTNTATTMRHGNDAYVFADLQVGWRVHVAGTPGTGGVLATSIEVQNTNGDIQVNVNGTIAALQGTATAFSFTVDGGLVKGDGATAFSGKDVSFAALKNGARVEVKGQQRNGYVYATSIHVN
jgi:hypothetical protein